MAFDDCPFCFPDARRVFHAGALVLGRCHRYERLVSMVEWKLIEMPLPRLQTVGDTQMELLYRIGWDERVRRSDMERRDFDRRIHLKPGSADCLLRFAGLLRPLIQQARMGMVVKMNRDATDEARLQEFLLGAERIALDPVRDGDFAEEADSRGLGTRIIAPYKRVNRNVHFDTW